jgi:hypothetical protein
MAHYQKSAGKNGEMELFALLFRHSDVRDAKFECPGFAFSLNARPAARAAQFD